MMLFNTEGQEVTVSAEQVKILLDAGWTKTKVVAKPVVQKRKPKFVE